MTRRFTEEFRTEAVRLVNEHGLSVARAAKDLGIGQSTLSKWLAAAGQVPGAESLSESEKEELKRLRKENHTLRMERDLLKKATAFFSRNTI